MLDSFVHGLGRVISISISQHHLADLEHLDAVTALAATGLAGDRHAGNKARQLTIQSRTELDEAEQLLGRKIASDGTRRNITIDAGLLPRTRGAVLKLGEVEVEVFADAAPCALMEDVFGRGARAALKRRAGIHCRVRSSGVIRVGDKLLVSELQPPPMSTL